MSERHFVIFVVILVVIAGLFEGIIEGVTVFVMLRFVTGCIAGFVTNRWLAFVVLLTDALIEKPFASNLGGACFVV